MRIKYCRHPICRSNVVSAKKTVFLVPSDGAQYPRRAADRARLVNLVIWSVSLAGDCYIKPLLVRALTLISLHPMTTCAWLAPGPLYDNMFRVPGPYIVSIWRAFGELALVTVHWCTLSPPPCIFGHFLAIFGHNGTSWKMFEGP